MVNDDHVEFWTLINQYFCVLTTHKTHTTFAPRKNNQLYNLLFMTRLLLTLATLACSTVAMMAQTVELEYTGELQTDFDGKYNFVNQLHLSLNKNVSKTVSLKLSTISTAKTGDHIIDDIQGFSNIEADNMPLAVAVAGVTWSINESNSLFAGIRRIDEDYFTSDVTGLFTNSSCGIYPTLSSNYPVATFPDAAMGIHYAHMTEQWGIQASVYNGTAHHRFSGAENVFRVCPGSDGVFTLAQGEFHGSNGDYFAGAAMHYGKLNDLDGRKACTTAWAYGEQHVSPTMSIIAGYSHAFGKNALCSDFAGVGAMWHKDKVQAGIFSDVASFTDVNEWATELTCRYDLNEHISLQPAFHFIHSDNNKVAALMRVSINL